MTYIIIILILLILFTLALKYIVPKSQASEFRKARFISDAEIRFYKVLSEAIGPKYRIFVKPRLNDIVYPVDSNRSRWQTTANKLRMKHVDFLLCDPANLTPICVVELDDSSHSQKDREARDGFVDNALKSAGIPISHFPVRATYSASEISQKISETLRKSPFPR